MLCKDQLQNLARVLHVVFTEVVFQNIISVICLLRSLVADSPRLKRQESEKRALLAGSCMFLPPEVVDEEQG